MTATALDAGEVVDHYTVVRRLGGGGFADVYEAVDERDGTHVVLKLPNIAILGDPQTYERFRRELEITKRLDHPNIQRPLNVGEKHSRPYIVLEYVEGETLREHLRGRLPLPESEAVANAVQLACALSHAHEHGVAHRDLKPENVLVTADGSLKLFDFGIALLSGARRVTWRGLTNAVGTPDYMAPEQIQGKRGDERTDIYALGTMLYEMLTGSVPFKGDNPLAVMQQVVSTPPQPVCRRNHAVSAALEAVVGKAMRKSPGERYASMDEMLADLENLDGLDLSAFEAAPENAPRLRPPMTDREMILYGLLAAVVFALASAVVILIVVLTTRR
jgi:eukaryotic-like serine/threonine-protein kinase